MVRYLVIMAKDQPDLYDYLTQNFAKDPKVQVILERRRGERRTQARRRFPERRRGQRRQQLRPISQALHRYVAVIRLNGRGGTGIA